MGFYSRSVVVNDAKRHQVKVLPVDINRSSGDCVVVDQRTIRLGLNAVRSIGAHTVEQVLLEREKQPFRNLFDFCQRTRLPQRIVENLIQAGAMDAFGASRRDLIWDMGKLRFGDELPLDDVDVVELPEATRLDLLNMAYDTLGLSTDDHIMAILRDWLQQRGIGSSRDVEDCPPYQLIVCAGLVVIRQAPPTAKGFRFITLEDEFGFINVIVRSQVYDSYRRVIRAEQLLLVRGEVQRERSVVNVMAQRINPLHVGQM